MPEQSRMTGNLTRRSFIATAAALGAAPFFHTARTRAAPSEGRLRHAAIGTYRRGRANLTEIASHEKVNIVVLCDVDERFLQEAAKAFPDARLYQDWREMLDAEHDNIDSVHIATPDHMHAPIALEAMRRGKHVYCEKPLTHDLAEARALTDAAREYGVVTQLGNQCQSLKDYRLAVWILQTGVIGKVREWHSWITQGYSTPGMTRPGNSDPVPDGFDWDLWLGTAPERPFVDELYHPRDWRYWQDFGTGAFGDFGCHIFDPIFLGTGVRRPLKVRAEVSEHDPEVWPMWEMVEFEFEGSDMTVNDTVTATWHDGGKYPEAELDALPADFELPHAGSVIVGEEGVMLLPHHDAPKLYPQERFKNADLPLMENLKHQHLWIDACLGGDAPKSNFGYGGPLTEAVLTGTVASRVPGKWLLWDAEAARFVDAPEANALLRRTYREGWHVEGLG